MTALRLPALPLSAFSCSLLLAASATAAEPVLPQLTAYTVNESWRQPVEPRQVAEHTWRNRTEGIHARLVKTAAGAVLIYGGMPHSADTLHIRRAQCWENERQHGYNSLVGGTN